MTNNRPTSSPKRSDSSARRPAARTRKSPLASILLVTLVLIALLGVVLLAIGYRYIKTDDVTFSGFIKNGQPVSGTVHYETGLSGKLAVDENTLHGTVTYNTGDVYTGTFKGILRDGKGTITYAKTDDVYEGDFLDDKLTGSAVITSSRGARYEGQVLDGKKNGFGKYTFPDGSYYYGNFQNDKRNGTGAEYYADGSYYYGAFVDDRKNGNVEVTVQLENGMIYTGKNKYVYANGDVYVGDFLNDLKSGKGTYTFASGESYTGDFAADTMNGTGSYTFTPGREPYTGTFIDGKIADGSAAAADTASPAPTEGN